MYSPAELIEATQILHEDNHLIIINKKSSEIVQGDKTGDMPLSEKVKNFIKQRDNKPGNVFCGVCHRLDRPVSGIVIFAKTSKALSRMNEIFRDKTTKRMLTIHRFQQELYFTTTPTYTRIFRYINYFFRVVKQFFYKLVSESHDENKQYFYNGQISIF